MFNWGGRVTAAVCTCTSYIYSMRPPCLTADHSHSLDLYDVHLQHVALVLRFEGTFYCDMTFFRFAVHPSAHTCAHTSRHSATAAGFRVSHGVTHGTWGFCTALLTVCAYALTPEFLPECTCCIF